MSNRTNFRAQQKSCWPLTFWYSEKESHRYLFEVIAGTPDTTDQIWINHLSLCTDCAKVCVGRIPLWLPPKSAVRNAACASFSKKCFFFSMFIFPFFKNVSTPWRCISLRRLFGTGTFCISCTMFPKKPLHVWCYSKLKTLVTAKVTVRPRILRRLAEITVKNQRYFLTISWMSG